MCIPDVVLLSTVVLLLPVTLSIAYEGAGLPFEEQFRVSDCPCIGFDDGELENMVASG